MRYLFLYLCTCYSALAMGQSNTIFYGGVGDGWGRGSYAQSIINRYKGGSGDGWGNGNYIQSIVNRYKGGSGDGWNMGNYVQAVVNRYSGGSGDGWNSAAYTQPTIAHHTGGSGDGWNTGSYAQLKTAIYKGGPGDGWASTYLPQGPLPVTFLRFDARKQGQAALLQWQMAEDDGEVATYHVQRSTDALSYADIGSVPQAATAKGQYTYTDKQPRPGNNYYRLRVVSRSGKQTYTPTRVVLFDANAQTEAMKVYPNPASSQVFVSLPAAYADLYVVLNVYNAAGAMVHQQKQQWQSGAVVPIDLGAWADGSYYIHAITSDNALQTTGKFIKLSK